MSITIRAKQHIDYVNGFPVEEGKALADKLLTLEESEWDGLEIDLCGVPSYIFISSFMRAIFQTVYEGNKDFFKRLSSVKWSTDFEFQSEGICVFIDHFEPVEVFGSDENIENKRKVLREFIDRLEAMEKSARRMVHSECTEEEYAKHLSDLLQVKFV